MGGLKTFWSFIKSSALEVLENKKMYTSAFLALVCLSNVETLYPFLGLSEDSNAYIIMTILSAMMVFVVLSQIVLIQKEKHGGSGQLGFLVPTFLLYNLYYSFLFFLGIVLFFIPGIYVLIFFSMVPFVAVLDDEADGQFFKKSRELVKKNISLAAWASVINLLIEFSALLFNSIQNPVIKAVSNFLFSLPDAFVTIILTIATVKVYYHLKALPTKPPEAPSDAAHI